MNAVVASDSTLKNGTVVYGENGDSNGDGEADIKDVINNLKEMNGREKFI